MVKEIKKVNRDLVIQSNHLIEAYYQTDLNATEHKIIRYAAAKVAKNPKRFPNVVFSVQEFLEAAGGLKGENYYSQFKKIAKPLAGKTIEIRAKNSKGETIGWITWFSSIYYENGKVYIKFNEEIKPLVLALEKQFTKYNFRYIGDMKSAYTIRLFELLKQYQSIGKRKIEVDELRKMLGLGNKYQRYGHFKDRVINQAKKELDKKGGLTFDFTEIKDGRKVVALEFDIKVNKKQLDMDDILFKKDSFISQVRDILKDYGLNNKISDDRIKEWEKYGIELVIDALDAVKDRKMNSPGAYITTVLEDMYKNYSDEEGNIEGIDKNQVLLIKKIKEFINRYKSDAATPGWFLKTKFIEYIKDDFTQEKAEEIWNKNERYIYNECNPWSKVKN